MLTARFSGFISAAGKFGGKREPNDQRSIDDDELDRTMWTTCDDGAKMGESVRRYVKTRATETMVGVVGQCICGLADDAEEESTRRRRRRRFVRRTG